MNKEETNFRSNAAYQYVDAMLESTVDTDMEDYSELRAWIDAEFEAHVENDDVTLPTKCDVPLDVCSSDLLSYCKQTRHNIAEAIKDGEVSCRKEPVFSTEELLSFSKEKCFLDLGTSPPSGSVSQTVFSTEELLSFSKEKCFLDLGTSPPSGSVSQNLGDSSDSIDYFDDISTWFNKRCVREQSMPQIISKYEHFIPLDNEPLRKTPNDASSMPTNNCVTSNNETSDNTSATEIETRENSNLSSQKLTSSDEAAW
eukprot:CAMPEP_0195539320 /NCGR_PEP_ID=MMETSP0794_2-20130614/49993_1 /TAXON_ID=515487 /ORGANISM="Stephanopyxis turris, Strain CCMP 815" /LENGTH=255 /DNA_ID=CAMNT_0040673345 /DNA_START=57 /DNA_END=822 /DNA_ORIENTATION=+